MTSTRADNSDAQSSHKEIRARVRVDERADRLAARLEDGEIAVVDVADMPRLTVENLINAAPVAVLNALPSSTGRSSGRGLELLHAAGIFILDDCGSDLMTLREGDVVSIRGTAVYRGDELIASGKKPDFSEKQEVYSSSSAVIQLEAFAAASGEYLEQEAPLLLEGRGLPYLSTQLNERTVLIIAQDQTSRNELKLLRHWIRDTNPVIIGVDSGADVALKSQLTPHIIVADMDTISEKALSCGAELVARSGHDGGVLGHDRLDRKGLSYEVVTMTGTSLDASVVLADGLGATSIVTVGVRGGIGEFLDRGRASLANALFFSRLKAGDKLISSTAVRASYRQRISVWYILLFLLVLVLAVGVALWSTPWGRDLLPDFAVPGTSSAHSSLPPVGGSLV